MKRKSKPEGVPDLLAHLEASMKRAKAARLHMVDGEAVALSPVEQDLAELAGDDGPEAA